MFTFPFIARAWYHINLPLPTSNSFYILHFHILYILRCFPFITDTTLYLKLTLLHCYILSVHIFTFSNELHLLAYILKAVFHGFQNPQIILNFSQRDANCQFCNVFILLSNYAFCSIFIASRTFVAKFCLRFTHFFWLRSRFCKLFCF